VSGVAVKGSRITTAVWWFDSVLWGLSSFACYLDDNFTNEPVARSFVAGVARPSRTREGESNGGCGEPPPPRTLWLLRLGVFTPSDGFALLQQHYGKGSCMAVAFLVWWFLPLLLLYRHRIMVEI
jgi:hypothetical protein